MSYLVQERLREVLLVRLVSKNTHMDESHLLIWDCKGHAIADCIIEEPCPNLCSGNLLKRLSYLNVLWSLDGGCPFDAWSQADLSTHQEECFCLCGHRVKLVHHVVLNRHQIRVGSKCIERFFPWLNDTAHENARELVRKTTACPRCDRMRLVKGQACPCSIQGHCRICDTVLKAGDFCLDCVIDTQCQTCHQLFQVKACMSWWTNKCENCLAN